VLPQGGARDQLIGAHPRHGLGCGDPGAGRARQFTSAWRENLGPFTIVEDDGNHHPPRAQEIEERQGRDRGCRTVRAIQRREVCLEREGLDTQRQARRRRGIQEPRNDGVVVRVRQSGKGCRVRRGVGGSRRCAWRRGHRRPRRWVRRAGHWLRCARNCREDDSHARHDDNGARDQNPTTRFRHALPLWQPKSGDRGAAPGQEFGWRTALGRQSDTSRRRRAVGLPGSNRPGPCS
jgi:hypothetical protein